jgi:hypothetical protein
MSEVVCPRCGAITTSLIDVDAERMTKISAATGESVPSQVCSKCMELLTGGTSQGSLLMMQEKNKEKRKLMLWKSRVSLIRKARFYMRDKMFSDAASTYEKYLKVLETVYDCGPGELNPEMFKDSARTQELTVVASVYWDLIRIYDTNEKYLERMVLACDKLAMFLKLTPIYPDIMKKAEIFAATARNQSVIKDFLKKAEQARGRCFIATSAYQSAHHPIVLTLTAFRDNELQLRWWGKKFIWVYYKISPSIARWMDAYPFVKPFIRLVLFNLTKLIHKNKS